MHSEGKPQAVILAGPNGAGKTTLAKSLLPAHFTFINADMIAQELTGHSAAAGDIQAGRVLIDRVQKLLDQRADFALETTLSSQSLLGRVRSWRELGYEVHLLYVCLSSEELAVQRVAERVRAGGHYIPEQTIRRRYKRSLQNFFSTYMNLVHTWRCYDNSSAWKPAPGSLS
jgi:predicted ABC-type ATPase